MIQRRASGLRLWPSAVGNGCQGTSGVKRTGRLSPPLNVERLYTSAAAGEAVKVTGQSPFTTGARCCPVAALASAAIPARTFPLCLVSKETECVCARGVATARPGTNFARCGRLSGRASDDTGGVCKQRDRRIRSGPCRKRQAHDLARAVAWLPIPSFALLSPRDARVI